MKPRRLLTISSLSEIRAASEPAKRLPGDVMTDVSADAVDRDRATDSELVTESETEAVLPVEGAVEGCTVVETLAVGAALPVPAVVAVNRPPGRSARYPPTAAIRTTAVTTVTARTIALDPRGGGSPEWARSMPHCAVDVDSACGSEGSGPTIGVPHAVQNRCPATDFPQLWQVSITSGSLPRRAGRHGENCRVQCEELSTVSAVGMTISR